MSPSIVAYNEYARGMGMNDWTVIMDQMPGVIFKGNHSQYMDLVIYLSNIVQNLKDPTRFRCAEDHGMIIPCMTKDWHLQNIPYRVWNIDHHHDCGYAKNLTYHNIMCQGSSCANWVLHMQKECPKLLQYTWIGNFNSDMGMPDEIRKHVPGYQMTTDIHIIDYINFDYVFLCSSPGWTPPEYLPLFNALRFSLEKLVNI